MLWFDRRSGTRRFQIRIQVSKGWKYPEGLCDEPDECSINWEISGGYLFVWEKVERRRWLVRWPTSQSYSYWPGVGSYKRWWETSGPCIQRFKERKLVCTGLSASWRSEWPGWSHETNAIFGPAVSSDCGIELEEGPVKQVSDDTVEEEGGDEGEGGVDAGGRGVWGWEVVRGGRGRGWWGGWG